MFCSKRSKMPFACFKSILLLWSSLLTLTIACDENRPIQDSDTSRAGDPAGDLVGNPAGDPAGDQAGDPAGDQAEDPAGDQAGQPAEVQILKDLNANPLSRGPAHVGYFYEELTYTEPIREAARILRIVYWYPALDNTGHGEATYPLFSPDQAEAEAQPHLNQPAPLLVYSHGAKVWPEMGAFMAEYFASHGWVVAAVAHSGDTIENVFGDRPDEIYAWRPLDLSAALNHIENLRDDHLLKGKINTNTAMVSGHSFGGYTTMVSAGAHFDMDHLRDERCAQRGESLCMSLEGPLGELMSAGLHDERFVAAIPQSAGNYRFLRSGTGHISIPTLMITATRDQACTEEGSNQPYWEALTSDRSPLRNQHRRLSFLDAGHATFTVACQHLPTLEQDDGCGPSFTPVLEAHQVMLAYSLIFGRAHVLRDESALHSIDRDEDLPNRPNWVQWLIAE